MCGILCCINKETPSLPEAVRPLVKIDGRLVWESNNVDYIRENFVDIDMGNLELTPGDQKKLDNIDELRNLNATLIKLNNNIKKDKKIEEERIKVENRISEICQVDETIFTEKHENILESLIYKISSRGPDYLNYTQFLHSGYNFSLFSSVLSLRQPFTKQPNFISDIILQFNGELYNQECLETNDTTFIINLLNTNLHICQSNESAILSTICQLNGEFAFIFLDPNEGKIYFGRDFVGRRSLLYALNNESIIISSLPSSEHTIFIECLNEIYIYDLKANQLTTKAYEQLWEQFPTIENISFNPMMTLFNFENSLAPKIERLYQELNRSCLVRQSTIHPIKESDSLLGILFSGGLDCTILASLICRNLQNTGGVIDLLTVGFDNPRTNQSASESPDRQLSKKSWFHLSKMYNSSTFTIRLIEINVSYKEWLMNKARVKKLMYPSSTEMDLSIAIAFYFASKYEGNKLILNNSNIEFEEFMDNEDMYTSIESNFKSNTKVLFSGLGADELFAGYSRHEGLFNDLKADALEDEIIQTYSELSKSLIYDIQVIHKRNLGRDDRVISSWGKELRYPFLDNQLISFVINEIEPNLKFFYRFESIVSKKYKNGKLVLKPIRKYLLRELADYLGLNWVKDELKRAIQFGAKSAKLEIGQSKARGTDSL